MPLVAFAASSEPSPGTAANAAIKGIMLPSGEVLYSDQPTTTCPWCELVDLEGCFMHLTCDNHLSRPAKRTANARISRRASR